MLTKLREVLSYQLSIAELLGMAIVFGAPAGRRPGGVVSGIDRLVAGSAVFERVHHVRQPWHFHPPPEFDCKDAEVAPSVREPSSQATRG
ncbi:hypothetical protein [Mycobacterium parmense]|uniref:Uncharacterized protein n=1 Tax=Mycobacterium parmense TaxID=185642 RepID=A0A7I7YWZ8_9MYCO|nr:hypothetical protein [Mycobacterium parmense]MCV7351285.1 hypothetical protein [Mycobacterium parmense]BBZ45261.1 hypothetical protein MPRM_25420 [Mycobacterium parmense]